MARPVRIEYEGAVYHVRARGNRDQPIVLDDDDRETFVRTLEETCAKSGWEMFAWVLMDDRYHLAVRTPEPNLVAGMTWFQNTVTRRFNAHHQLHGHLFGDRYRAIPVEHDTSGDGRWSDDYLASLIDYIHLNPARAGIVNGKKRSVRDYPWSSLASDYVAPPSKRRPWMAVAEGLDLLGYRDDARGRRRHVSRLDEMAASKDRKRAGLVEKDGQGLRSTLRKGWYWGSPEFREDLLDRFADRLASYRTRQVQSSPMAKDQAVREAERIVAEACAHYGVDEEELRRTRRGSQVKPSVAWRIWRETTVSQGWLAERLHLKTSANVSQQIRRFDGMDEKTLPKPVRAWKKLSKMA